VLEVQEVRNVSHGPKTYPIGWTTLPLFSGMYVRVYVYMCVCTYACMYGYIYIHIYDVFLI